MKWPDCMDCGRPIPSTNDVTIWVKLSDIRSAEYEDWEERTAEATRPDTIHATILGQSSEPTIVKIYLGHRKCGPENPANWYEGSVIDTPKKLLDLSAHLFEKRWFRFSDWPDFVRMLLAAYRA